MMPSRTLPFFLLAMVCCGLTCAGDRDVPKRGSTKGSVLLIVDAQVGVLATAWESDRVIGNLERLVDKARTRGVPVVWVQHENRQLVVGSDAWKIVPSLVPGDEELILRKRYNSSFADSELDPTLKELGVSNIVLAGAATNWCIRATAYAAVDRGYNLTLVADAHTTEDMALDGGKVVTAASMIADLNAVFEWISVPDVKTTVVNTDAVTF